MQNFRLNLQKLSFVDDYVRFARGRISVNPGSEGDGFVPGLHAEEDIVARMASTPTDTPKRGFTLIAFAIIYFVWGSTFLAIRIGDRELPPLLFAAMRFSAAGLALFLWRLARRAAWFALLYLIVFGSILGFTAYVWLISHHSPTKVGTYAYVNPLVAVLLGYLFASEPLGLRTILGTLCVFLSVVLITTTGQSSRRAAGNSD